MTAVIGAVEETGPPAVTTNGPAPLPTGSRPVFLRLLAAERIKLLSTRSVWWCGSVTVLVLVGLTALLAAVWEPTFGPTWGIIGWGMTPGVAVAVLGALAVTGEHRCGTVRTTFLAAPDRVRALLAKTVVVAVAAAVIGLIASFAAWGVARLIVAPTDLVLTGAGPWRAVAGLGLTYPVVAILAVAVGILLRNGAGAVGALLGWWVIGEKVLVPLVQGVTGLELTPWLPLHNLSRFLTVGIVDPDPSLSLFAERLMFAPWPALGYSAAVAIGVLAVAVVVARRRDA
jgi:ABC-2 type transport system permease protein